MNVDVVTWNDDMAYWGLSLDERAAWMWRVSAFWSDVSAVHAMRGARRGRLAARCQLLCLVAWSVVVVSRMC